MNDEDDTTNSPRRTGPLSTARHLGGKAVRPYRGVLSKPGALGFSAAGALARLPMSMVTLSMILLVTASYGEYALAGRVVAVYAVAQALCAPQLAKLIDRYGQSRVMRPSLAVAITSFLCLLVVANLRVHEAALYAIAVLGGATVGSMGALVRSRWSQTVGTPRELHVAFSLESAIDELLFVVGPVLATVLATSFSPTVSLLVAIAASAVGGFWFLSQKGSEPPASGRPERGATRTTIASGTLVAVALVFIAMGIIFGAADVATVAFAEDLGRKSLSGVILGIFALGSLLAGLWFGASHFAGPLWRRFVLGTLALAVGVSMFAFASNLWVLAIAMFVAGFTIAPTIITGNAIVQASVPAERLTEGLSWVGTSIGVGFAIGTSVTGRVVDAGVGHDGYFVVMAAAGIAALVAVVSIPALRRSARA